MIFNKIKVAMLIFLTTCYAFGWGIKGGDTNGTKGTGDGRLGVKNKKGKATTGARAGVSLESAPKAKDDKKAGKEIGLPPTSPDLGDLDDDPCYRSK